MVRRKDGKSERMLLDIQNEVKQGKSEDEAVVTFNYV